MHVAMGWTCQTTDLLQTSLNESHARYESRDRSKAFNEISRKRIPSHQIDDL